MQDEIELKLAVENIQIEQFASILAQFNVIAHQKAFLANTYYDTADGYFTRHKMGLRVRQKGDDYTLTLKTDGKVSGGLHVRPEYNVALPNAEPNLAALTEHYELSLETTAPLNAIFSTDFERHMWLIQATPTSQIEVAVDVGKVIAGEKQQTISEIEFEIKEGGLAPFFAFVADFLNHYQGNVHFYSMSKAKRGYQLAQGTAPKSSDWIERWRGFLHTEKYAKKTSEKLTALLHYEQALIEETLALGADHFATDFIKTVERVGAFFNLAHYYDDNKNLLEAALNEQVAANHHYALENVLTALTEANAQFLAQIREIIRLHSETKDNGLAMRKLFDLIQTPQYAQRMLHLMTLTLGEE